MASKEAGESAIPRIGLTEEEVQNLIDVSVAAIFERAYNEALDDVLSVLNEGLDPEDLKHRLESLRKTCFVSSSPKQ